ncbi:MAG: hypothetical protein R3A52_28660 [Polyangiales bacterium]
MVASHDDARASSRRPSGPHDDVANAATEHEPGGVHVITGASEEGLSGDRVLWFSGDMGWWGYGGRRWGHRWYRGGRSPTIRGNAQPFISGGVGPSGEPGDACAVFPVACSAPSPRRARPASEVRAATVAREGDDWVLENGAVTARLVVGADCAMTLLARGGRAAFATFDAPRCVVRPTAAPWSDREGAAVMIDWSGDGWSQRAVVALADDGDAPEATISQTVREGSFAETRAVNLSDGARVWTVGDREVALASGESTHYGVRLGRASAD